MLLFMVRLVPLPSSSLLPPPPSPPPPAIYLCKRTMQNKARLELADYEAVSCAVALASGGKLFPSQAP